MASLLPLWLPRLGASPRRLPCPAPRGVLRLLSTEAPPPPPLSAAVFLELSWLEKRLQHITSARYGKRWESRCALDVSALRPAIEAEAGRVLGRGRVSVRAVYAYGVRSAFSSGEGKSAASSSVDLVRALTEEGVMVRMFNLRFCVSHEAVPVALAADFVHAATLSGEVDTGVPIGGDAATAATGGAAAAGGAPLSPTQLLIVACGTLNYLPAMVRASQRGRFTALATTRTNWASCVQHVDASVAGITAPLLMDAALEACVVPIDKFRAGATPDAALAAALHAQLLEAAGADAPMSSAEVSVVAARSGTLRQLRRSGLSLLSLLKGAPQLFSLTHTPAPPASDESAAASGASSWSLVLRRAAGPQASEARSEQAQVEATAEAAARMDHGSRGGAAGSKPASAGAPRPGGVVPSPAAGQAPMAPSKARASKRGPGSAPAAPSGGPASARPHREASEQAARAPRGAQGAALQGHAHAEQALGAGEARGSEVQQAEAGGEAGSSAAAERSPRGASPPAEATIDGLMTAALDELLTVALGPSAVVEEAPPGAAQVEEAPQAVEATQAAEVAAVEVPVESAQAAEVAAAAAALEAESAQAEVVAVEAPQEEGAQAELAAVEAPLAEIAHAEEVAVESPQVASIESDASTLHSGDAGAAVSTPVEAPAAPRKQRGKRGAAAAPVDGAEDAAGHSGGGGAIEAAGEAGAAGGETLRAAAQAAARDLIQLAVAAGALPADVVKPTRPNLLRLLALAGVPPPHPATKLMDLLAAVEAQREGLVKGWGGGAP